MKIPTTYADWLACFDQLKRGGNDEELANCMNKGTIDWVPGVADRFMKQFVEVINFRMNIAKDSFARATNHSAYASETNLITALLKLRKDYKFLIELTKIPAIPSEYASVYTKQLIDQIDLAQKSLEDSAQRTDRSGKLLHTIRNNRVNNL